MRPFIHTRARTRTRARTIARPALLALAVVGGSSAASIPIVNAGFEDASAGQPYNEFTFGPPAGWSLHDPNGVAGGGAGPVLYVGTLTPVVLDPVGAPGVYEYFPAGAPEGQRVGIAFNFAGSGNLGEYGLVQTLDAVLEAETTYTLTALVGNIAAGTSVDGSFFDLDGFPGYRVELLAGGAVVAQDDNSLSGSTPEGTFAPTSVSITTGRDHPQLGEALAVRLVNLNLVDPAFPGSDLEVDFDDVRLDAEPAAVGPDLNGDGAVDGADLGLLLAAWGQPGGDLDGSGTTDGADLGLLLAAWR